MGEEELIALARVTSSIDSDFEKRRALSAILERPDPSPGLVSVILEKSLAIGSDFEQASFLRTLAAACPVEGPVSDPFFEAAATIGSDYEQQRALSALLEGDEIHRDTLRLAMETAAQGIASDYELAKFLVHVAAAYPLDDELREVYLAAAGSIGSDYENNRALAALARNP
jgi:hypothetical protein